MNYKQPKKNWTLNDMPDQTGKIVVITGGTSGVGYEDAKAFAMKNAMIHILAHNLEKGQKAIAELKHETGNQNIFFHSVNLMSITAIKEFAKKLLETTPKIDVLINNAGIMMPAQARLSEDGLESMWATNYFGGFTLTMSLLPALKKSTHARVVNLTSLATGKPEIDLDNLDGHDYNAWKVYIATKMAQAMISRKLNSIFQEQNISVTVLAASPGLAATNLVTKKAGATSIMMRVGAILFKVFPNIRQSASQAALPTLYAATDSNAEGGAVYAPNNKQGTKGYPALWGWNESKYMDMETASKLLDKSLEIVDDKL
ncbi:SDR family NAD(P)-dependent oxidoreductase [Lentilactobacillus sp. SPB1-3]|uniref:SDR family NAD(P)-dependent oxidoreductase n=1 Tax=Lentilactobacillus terminaliae TaxID=3003483 RepID=A0ACD5DHG6_9LACO|nr:SDR family NAD(P)-dependent oxidoreductase [Lentilactobacillus sp. SPB1-3]MCZ0977046.1 SDR family NAD(P)-dependent oxidoreductase [Lentilactobacillus sp. SPB1-3]